MEPIDKKRVLLSGQLKTALIKCYNEIEILLKSSHPSQRTIENKVASIFSVSRSQVHNVVKCYKKGEILQDSKTGKRTNGEIFRNEEFKKQLMEQINRYLDTSLHFTLNDLLAYAKTNLGFTGGRTTLSKILKTMGYKYKKVHGKLTLTLVPPSEKKEANKQEKETASKNAVQKMETAEET